MANKIRKVPIVAETIKKRLKEIKSSQVELADFLGITPRHLNRCLSEEEMAEDLATKTAYFLDINISEVIILPYELPSSLEGTTFTQEIELIMKMPENQRKLFTLFMRYCGISEREISTYSDESIFSGLHLLSEIARELIIEPHRKYLIEELPELWQYVVSTDSDDITEKKKEGDEID